jgi:hypothetical protein
LKLKASLQDSHSFTCDAVSKVIVMKSWQPDPGEAAHKISAWAPPAAKQLQIGQLSNGGDRQSWPLLDT